MKKITLAYGGTTLGMGYMTDTEQDRQALAELRRQIARSGIRGELTIEDTDTMDMNALGNEMAEAETAMALADRLAELGEEYNENDFVGYDLANYFA